MTFKRLPTRSWGKACLRFEPIRVSLVEDQVAYRERLAELHANRQLALGDDVRMHDGRIFERDYVPVALEGGRQGHLILSREVTEQRLREQQRDAMLEAERSLRAAMEEQNDTLLKLADMKSEFIADVSHELKTPLSSIMGYTELLLDEQAALPQRIEFVEAIDRNVRRLLRVVEDLLMQQRFESGAITVDPRPVEPTMLIESALRALGPQAQMAKVELRLETSDTGLVNVDPGRIDQLLVNLLSNAIKFTPRGGRVVVRSTRAASEWLIEVSDTGMGIPIREHARLVPSLLPRVERTRKGCGYRLGPHDLPLNRRVARRRHFRRQRGRSRGTTIRVELPAERGDV